MTEKILLAILVGVVLTFIAMVGVSRYARSSKSNEEMRKHVGFHVFIVSYIIGQALKYIGLALLFAHLIHKHILP